MADKITKDMTFFHVMNNFPESIKVLQQYNLGCIGCMGAQNESLEQGAKAHGIDVNEFLIALNKAVS